MDDDNWLQSKGPERIRTSLPFSVNKRDAYQGLEALYNDPQFYTAGVRGEQHDQGVSSDPARLASLGVALGNSGADFQDLLRLTQREQSPMHAAAHAQPEATSPTNMLLSMLGLAPGAGGDTPHRNNSHELHNAFKSLPTTPLTGLSGAFGADGEHLQHLQDILQGTNNRHLPAPNGDHNIPTDLQRRTLDQLISQIDDHTGEGGSASRRQYADLRQQQHGQLHHQQYPHHSGAGQYGHQGSGHPMQHSQYHAGFQGNEHVLLDLFKDASPTASHGAAKLQGSHRAGSGHRSGRPSSSGLGPGGGGITKSATGRPMRAAAGRNTLVRVSQPDLSAGHPAADWPTETRQNLIDLVNKFDPKNSGDWQLIAAALGKRDEAELVERAFKQMTSHEHSNESNTSGSMGASKPSSRPPVTATANKHGRRLNSRKGIPMHIMATYALMRLPGHEGNLSDMSAKIEANAFFCKQLDWTPRPGTKTYPRWKDALVGCFKPGRYPHLKKTLRKKEGLTVYALVESQIPEKSVLKPSMVADVDPSQLPDDFDAHNPLVPLKVSDAPSGGGGGGADAHMGAGDVARVITTGTNVDRVPMSAAAAPMNGGARADAGRLASMDDLGLGASNSMRSLVPGLESVDGASGLVPNLSSLMPSLSLQKHMNDIGALRPAAG